MCGVVPLITQDVEYDEDVHLPPFSTKAVRYGFSEEEARERADTEFNSFSRHVLGNSSAPVSDISESDILQGQDTIVMTGDMSVVQDQEQGRVQTYDQILAARGFGTVIQDEEVRMTAIDSELVDSPSVAPHAGSSTFAQAQREALRLQAMEEQYS
jgi:hypothetical protein